jgi:sec-independent protein translocase protein TatA
MVGLDNPLHIALVLVVVLLVFGAKRLPEMGKSMGAGLRGFKDSLQGDTALAGAPGPLLTQTSAEHATAATPVRAPVAVTDGTPVAVTDSTPPAA